MLNKVTLNHPIDTKNKTRYKYIKKKLKHVRNLFTKKRHPTELKCTKDKVMATKE